MLKIWNTPVDTKTWNVCAAEKDIDSVYQFAKFYLSEELGKAAENMILPQLFGDNKQRKTLFAAAAKEMCEIIFQKENSSGYHLNHVTSGKTVYTLWNNNGTVSKQIGEDYDDKELAEAAAQRLDNACVETVTKEGKTFYKVMQIDKEATADLREQEIGGEFVADFDTEEEANEEAESMDDAYVLPMDSEEWWVVIENKTSKSPYQMMFPTRKRALAFLYHAAKPKAWMEYQAYISEEVAHSDD